ncbi:hypothetical protein [Spirosoma fluminis]
MAQLLDSYIRMRPRDPQGWRFGYPDRPTTTETDFHRDRDDKPFEDGQQYAIYAYHDTKAPSGRLFVFKFDEKGDAVKVNVGDYSESELTRQLRVDYSRYELRETDFSLTEAPRFVYIIDPAAEGDFVLDVSDTTSADDGLLTLVTGSGLRYKRRLIDLDFVANNSDLEQYWLESKGVIVGVDNVEGSTKRLMRFMAWARVAAYVAANMTLDYVAYFAQRLAPFFTLEGVLRNGSFAPQSIHLTENGNYVTRQSKGSPAADRGHYHQVENEDGSITVASFEGHSADNLGRVMVIHGKTVEKSTVFQKIWGYVRLEASATVAWFKSVGIKSLATTKKADGIVVSDWDTDELGHRLSRMTFRDMLRLAFEDSANRLYVADLLREYLPGGGGGPSDPFVVEAGHLLCQELPLPDTPTGSNRQRIDITTPISDGSPVLHSRNTTTPAMDAYIRLPDGTLERDNAISYKPTTNPNQLTINLPGGGSWQGRIYLEN